MSRVEVVNWIRKNVSVLILEIGKGNCWIKAEVLVNGCDSELPTELDVVNAARESKRSDSTIVLQSSILRRDDRC